MDNVTGKPIPPCKGPVYLTGPDTYDLPANVYAAAIQLDEDSKIVNLPSLSNTLDGYSITISSFGTGQLTLIPDGSDTIASTTSLVVSENTISSCIVLASLPNSNWVVMSSGSNGGGGPTPVSVDTVTLYSGGQTISPRDTAIPIIWTNVVSNISNMWNPSMPTRLTQPTGVDSGQYLVEYVVRWSGSPAGTRESFIRVNGGTDAFAWHRDRAISNLTRNGSALIQLNSPTDYVELCVVASVTVPLNAGSAGTNPRSAPSANRITMRKL